MTFVLNPNPYPTPDENPLITIPCSSQFAKPEQKNVGIDPAKIPSTLRELSQWVVWKYEVDAKGRPTKIPYRSRNPRVKASSTDSGTWGSFLDALKAYANRAKTGVDGIGFVFADGGGMVGVDFDNCLGEDGQVLEWAAAYLDGLKLAYLEISPSGRGIKGFLLGSLPSNGNGKKKTGYGDDKRGAIEVYAKTRYFTVTSNAYTDATDLSANVAQVIEHLYADVTAPKPTKGMIARTAPRPGTESDDQLIDKARRATDGDRFSALFDSGDLSQNDGNASQADLALMGKLAFWTDRDAARMEAIFGRSALGQREKWQRPDYRQRTIDKAITGTVATYSPLSQRITNHDRGGEPANGKAREPIQRVKILVTLDEMRVNDEAVEALGNDDNLYRVTDHLVTIVDGDSPMGSRGVEYRDGVPPRLVTITPATLSERLSKVAIFVKKVKDKDGNETEITTCPPTKCINAVMDRKHWPRVPDITAIVEAPTIRPDRSIIDTPGYDKATGIYYAPNADFAKIPDRPSLGDCQEAAALLLGLISDFPLMQGHEATWLAALLTVVGRPAIGNNPCPMFPIDGNCAGTGKSLLADLIALILTSRPMARMVLPQGRDADEEMRKRITSLALNVDLMVLLDNVPSGYPLGLASLDAALTGTTWNDRLLGKNQTTRPMLLWLVWFATGNNLIFKGDLPRRVSPQRLKTDLEHPENRTEFKHPNIVQHVKENRPKYLVAALTILRGFHVAGEPRSVPPLGSYEVWTALIANAVAWATGRNPLASRELLAVEDIDMQQRKALFEALAVVPKIDHGVTAKQIIDTANEVFPQVTQGVPNFKNAGLREALFEFSRDSNLPSPKILGHALRALKDRVVDSQRLISSEDKNKKTQVWRLEALPSVAGIAGMCGYLCQDFAGNEKDKNLNGGNSRQRYPHIPAIPANQREPGDDGDDDAIPF